MRFEHDRAARVLLVCPESPEDKDALVRLRGPFRFNRHRGSLVVPEYATQALHGLPGALPWLRESIYAPTDPDPLGVLECPFAGRLYPFQRQAVNRMLEPGGFGLWLDCGLGKSPVILAAYDILRRAGKVRGMIVLGPNVASQVWTGEGSLAHQWIGEVGHEIKTGDKRYPPTEGIIFCSHAKTFRLPYRTWVEERLRSGQWILAVDEAQMISGEMSRRFEMIHQWAQHAPWRWLASGTPVANYPDSFRGLYKIMTRANFEPEAYLRWFKAPSGEFYRSRLEDFGRILKQDSMRITKAEAAPWLPPRTNQVLTVDLKGRQRALYDQFIREGKVMLQAQEREWAVHGRNVFARLARLAGLATHPGMLGDLCPDTEVAKLETVLDLLKTAGDQKVVIWSWHPWVLDWLRGKLPLEAVRYHGQVPDSERKEATRRFNTDPDTRVFLGNPSAAGTALSLGAGSIAIYWDMGWRWVDYFQAGERIDRITRTLPITQYVLLGKNTVEEYMWEKVQLKIDLQGLMFGTTSPEFLTRHWTPQEAWRVLNMWG